MNYEEIINAIMQAIYDADPITVGDNMGEVVALEYWELDPEYLEVLESQTKAALRALQDNLPSTHFKTVAYGDELPLPDKELGAYYRELKNLGRK